MKCPSCAFDNPPGMRFCGQCGAGLSLTCPACGSQNPVEFKFCGRCGKALTESSGSRAPTITQQIQIAEEETTAKLSAEPVSETAENRQLTVMFCDLVGSTALAELLDPESLRQVVMAYQEVASEVIDRFEGHVAQLLGDGLLVYFGYPRAHEDDPRRAVHAALGVVEAIAKLNERQYSEEDFQLAVRVGIHTGQVVTGDVGAGGRWERLAVGQTPNVAARLQGLAEANGIVMSATTQANVEGLFATDLLGPQTLKGVSKPIDVYRVLAESGVPERFQAAAQTGLPPLIGRRQELEQLQRAFDTARGGERQVVLLNGEAGFGKSRLVHELKLGLEAVGHRWLTCYCSPYHQNSPLHPVIEQAMRLFRIPPDATPEDKAAHLEHELARRELDLPEAFPLIAGLLSLPLLPAYSPSSDTPQRQRERTLDILRTIVHQQSANQPLVLVIENLQWADPSTLQFLESLLPQSNAKLLILITCRPAYEPPWAAEGEHVEIRIDRLSEEQIIEVVDHWTSGKTLPRPVLRQVIEKTDGVPLFVEELTKTILESGILVEKDGIYSLPGALPTFAIPSTLQDSLRARLDRLPPAIKEVAQIGSVIGRRFSYDLLDMISPQSSRNLESALADLVDAELLFQGGNLPTATYRFKHVMIQEATYSSLLKRQRQLYHRRIAQALEDHFLEVCETQPEVVAYHLTEAGQHDLGVDYWQQASQRSFMQGAVLEARAQIDSGLELLESLPEGAERDQRELALQAAKGAALSTLEGFAAPNVSRAYGRALEICQRGGDAPEQFWILWGLWRFHFVQANLDKALELAQTLLRLANPQRGPTTQIAAYFTAGATLYCRGELAVAHDYLGQAINLDSLDRTEHYAAQSGEDSGVASLIWDGWCLWLMGYPEQARKRRQQAQALARRIAHPFSITYSLIPFQSYYERELTSFLQDTETTLAQSLEQGFWFAIPGQLCLGWGRSMEAAAVHDANGDGLSEEGAEGLEVLRQGIAATMATGARLHRTQYLLMLAEAAASLGVFDEAERNLNETFTAIRESGERFFEAEAYRLQGEIKLLAGPADREELQQFAERSYQQALEVAREQGARALQLRTAVSLARLRKLQQRGNEARDLLALLLAEHPEGTDSADLRDAHQLLDDFS
ncbi:MAG: AAA family ATPase [Acidobacteriota bacterium]